MRIGLMIRLTKTLPTGDQSNTGRPPRRSSSPMPVSAVFIIGIRGGRRHKLRIGLVGNPPGRRTAGGSFGRARSVISKTAQHSTHFFYNIQAPASSASAIDGRELNSNEKAKLAVRKASPFLSILF